MKRLSIFLILGLCGLTLTGANSSNIYLDQQANSVLTSSSLSFSSEPEYILPDGPPACVSQFDSWFQFAYNGGLGYICDAGCAYSYAWQRFVECL